MAPTIALAGMGLFSPACCCGGPPAPIPGAAGSISGQILFAETMTPSPLSVYAVENGSRYVMAKVSPPDRTFHLAVPPGYYEVVARLDSNPLSSAGHLECVSAGCAPVMTRAGYVTCQSVDCQPVLIHIRVDAATNIYGVDVGGWGSLAAINLLWRVDEYGAPGPLTYQLPTPGVTPSPTPLLPLRQLPPASTVDLPAIFAVPNQYDVKLIDARLHLPAGWRQVPNPGEATDQSVFRDFANQAVRSPLALDGDGVWLTVSVSDFCSPAAPAPPVAGTARGVVTTANGLSTFFFDDPHSAIGQQPFSGYAFSGEGKLSYGICASFRFTAMSDQARERYLPTFLAIVQQAEFAK